MLTRCIIKVTYIAGELAVTSCLAVLREFSQQLQRQGNKKCYLLPWEEKNLDSLEPILQPSGMPITALEIGGYILRFFCKKRNRIKIRLLSNQLGACRID